MQRQTFGNQPAHVSTAEHQAFAKNYRSAWASIQPQYAAKKGKVAAAILPAANYLHALGFHSSEDRPLILAALVRGLDPSSAESALRDEKPSVRDAVLSIHRTYRDIVENEGQQINVVMGTHVSNLNARRASLVRAADLLYQIESQRPHNADVQLVNVAEKLYLPLYYHVYGMKRLADDLGNSVLKLRDPERYRMLYAYLERHESTLRPILSPLQEWLTQVLEQQHVSLGSISFEGRRKSVISTHLKLADPRKNYTLDTLPDPYGIRILFKPRVGESPEQTASRVQAYGRMLVSRLKNGVQLDVPSGNRVQRVHVRLGNNGEIDDYIASPKESGYRAFHFPLVVQVRGAEIPLEGQIASTTMHEKNTFGGAAHLGYKLRGIDRKREKQLLQLVAQGYSRGDVASSFRRRR